MVRCFLAVTLLTFAGAVAAQAAGAEAPAAVLEAAVLRAAALPRTPVPVVGIPVPPVRPAVLPALYVSLGVLQAYDVYSTLGALDRGAVEANPLMRGVVGQPVAFGAVKAGATGASIYAAERLWRDKRVHAVLLVAAANGAMAYVARHNARVLAAR